MKFPAILMTMMALASSAFAADPISGAARVIDGDTIAIGATHVRIAYIDAPETRQVCRNQNGSDYLCGRIATLAMRDLIAGMPVTCQSNGTDLYGRAIGVCGTDAIPDLGREMVARGWAVDFVKYDRACIYCGEQDAAHKSDAGLWAGTFDMPWIWRAEHRR